MAKKKTKPVESNDAPENVVVETKESTEPKEVQVTQPVPLPPVALGAPGSIVKPDDSDELSSVIKNAASYKGRTIVVLRDGLDILAAQKLIHECKSDHHIGVKINPKLQVRALWRCQ